MGVSLVFLAAAAWVALRGHATDIVGHFLLGANDNIPTVTAILAAVAAAVAFCLGLAALNAAARMRVLARDRRIPAPLSPGMRRARDLLLTPLGPATVRLVKDPDLPPGKLPDDDASEAQLRLTVLLPAHDERLTIEASLASLWAQTRQPDRVVVVADNCTDDTADIARQTGRRSSPPSATPRRRPAR